MPVKKTKKVSSTKSTKKTAAKSKAAPKATKKSVAKTTAKKRMTKAQKEKIEQFNKFSLDTCIEMAKAMGIAMDYDQYASMLMESADIAKLSENVLSQYNVDKKAFSFEKDGYDTDLIPVIFERVEKTAVVTASDFTEIADKVKKHQEYVIQDDSTLNNDEYKTDFDVVREVLIIAQKKDVRSTEDMEKIINVNPKQLIVTFADLAYKVLNFFEFDDVKYYEKFIFAVLSQFDDLRQEMGNRILMDVADLYIQRGDYSMGDANYQYILRENEIKDYIYYRYASIYQNGIDVDKAKSIAATAMQVVGPEYEYYEKINKILEA